MPLRAYEERWVGGTGCFAVVVGYSRALTKVEDRAMAGVLRVVAALGLDSLLVTYWFRIRGRSGVDGRELARSGVRGTQGPRGVEVYECCGKRRGSMGP